ncbi:hypothetical protein F4779DRAFT_562289 [Xylariaceae sp. FL0662B]|nr:hypothetical protein F4779DRAFT_562289 [Xylariaceae sp. FL0662B]
MASPIRFYRPLNAPPSLLRNQGSPRSSCRRHLSTTAAAATRPSCIITTTTTTRRSAQVHPRSTLAIAPFHTTAVSRRRSGGSSGGNDDDGSSATSFDALNVLGNTPVPASSVDVCTSDGFQLNSGARVHGGCGVLLVGGEPFRWRPWLARRGDGGEENRRRLLNQRGQWEVPNEAFGLLGLVWPRPDLLILGLGPEIRPISPQLRNHISSLGMKVEILDTRNAAAQFNLLATERGVDDVAAALIPIGWREGVGVAS